MQKRKATRKKKYKKEIDLSPLSYRPRLDPDSKKYIIFIRRCPLCGSPSGHIAHKDKDGDPVWHCFACGRWIACRYA